MPLRKLLGLSLHHIYSFPIGHSLIQQLFDSSPCQALAGTISVCWRGQETHQDEADSSRA